MTTRVRPSLMWKAFTSFSVTISFVVIASSGLVLYVAPAGRVANWSGWTLGELVRAQWQAVHTIFAFLFVFAAVVHLVFNWRVLLAYVSRQAAERRARWRELGLAMAAATTILILTINSVPPFSAVMTAGESIKASWSTGGNEPPIPHAEILTLARLAETTRLSAESMLAKADAAGVSATGDTTLAEIARQMGGITPAEAFRRLTADQGKPLVSLANGGGWGQKTVEQVCGQIAVPVSEGLARLRGEGIEAEPGSNIREVAARHGRMPLEIVKTLQGN